MRSDGLLFAHILSAMILFGGVLTVVTVSVAAQQRAWPAQIPLLRALAFRTNLLIVLPGFIAVHVFGDLLANREFEHGQPDWLDLGFAITDIDLIVGGVILTLLQFWVLRRTRAGRPDGWPASVASILPWIVLAGLVAAIVLMAGKPVG
jgi:uncharacterized BrkB/YihY/UPF0761 family membrane protein